MNEHRRAGAPRLIDWTGERCVPWAPDVQVVYEHLHRYMWAAELVDGRRVLDLASGEGFGAAILADRAASVVGIDIDRTTVEHSKLNYATPRIEFRVGDALDLSTFAEDSFGAVVAFEMVEHVLDQDRLLAEIARVLEPGGLLVMSTPDRRAYSDATGQQNPFHTHELDADEFSAMLAARFANVAVWGQRTITGSALAALSAQAGEGSVRTLFVERSGDEFRSARSLSPLYLVAIASDRPLPRPPADSVLGDCGLAMLRALERRSAEELGRERQQVHEQHVADARVAQQAIEAAQRAAVEAEAKAIQARGMADAARREVASLERGLADRTLELDTVFSRCERLRDGMAQDEGTIAALRTELERSAQFVRRVELSVTWRTFQRVRASLFAAAGGEGSLAVRGLQWFLRTLGRPARSKRPRHEATAAQPDATFDAGIPVHALSLFDFPVYDHPEVSLVIPLYARADLTRRCLESIRDGTAHVSYEVILVDDDADAETQTLLSQVRGAEIIVNEVNCGYLRSVNAGASVARGRWLVLCNNDIEVTPGWLSSLVERGDSAPDIAVVTPKYLYPDGSVNEAGGIIWSNGTGVNYGRGDAPDVWRYEYVREVDYGSAAALLVRTDFWRQRGGYDERFLPMYYEDADLCFDARERGLRVVYEPAARVIHHEGATAGTDVTAGHKRHQEENRSKFVSKWHERLEAWHLRPIHGNLRRALERLPAPHVLIVDHRVPMPDHDAGSVRMASIISTFRKLGCRVTFLPDDLNAIQPYTRDLQRLGAEVLYPPINCLEELSSIGPSLDLVIASRPHATARWLDMIAELAPTARIVYDTVDLHWLREARRNALVGGGGKGELSRRATVLRELELALIRATDTVLVVTEDERAQVETDVPGADVRIVPIVYSAREHVPPREVRSGVLFVGGFEHTPNVDAAIRLVRGVMPRVWRERGDVSVTIVGSRAPSEVQTLASVRVEIAGWVPDLEQLLGSSLALVAPLSYGAGLKGKVTQALAAGLPVVTTPIGAEGLEAIDGQQLLIGETDDQLAERIIRLVDDAELWSRLSTNGQAVIAEHFSDDVMQTQLELLLDCKLRAMTS
ncbi:MAG: methyltransferase domain-containing protein [Solirubrobacteraceae bacterium]